MRVLVLDDSRAMRTILGSILRDIGFEVVEACDGEEALERVRENPDLSLGLVDWNLPGMSGVDFVTAVRALGRTELKLMMVTTETELGRMSLALESGADEYIMKPFTKDMLIEKLDLIGFELGGSV